MQESIQTIYYVFERATGIFAGSGITEYNDETYGSTTIAPPEEPLPPVCIWDAVSETWSWVPQE